MREEQERAAAAKAAAASEAAKKPSVPVFASSKSKTPNQGIFGAIGSVFKVNVCHCCKGRGGGVGGLRADSVSVGGLAQIACESDVRESDV